ncbi:MAG: flavodoxin family protein [Anaerolineae bacterium]|nr:flavodoxin family protein [Anaerolineae bacterium]
MAKILGILGGARRDGYTVRVLDRLLGAAGATPEVEVERVDLLDYRFGPCRSCYECIRRAQHRCILPDDMGQEGAGTLWQRIEAAHAMVWATPVHCWTADALIHLFIERLYPFLWSGELRGIPVATLSVASNQGFQIEAHKLLCQWAFTTGARYVGGLPVHAAYLDEALRDAEALGRRLAEAALQDERQGRHASGDEQLWLAYETAPWSVYAHYVENLTRGTGASELSLIERSLAQGTFQREEALNLLRQADEAFQTAVRCERMGQRQAAIEALVRASALWTHATWKEFLEEQLIGAPPPETYRPLK